jgi:hypothetical protein
MRPATAAAAAGDPSAIKGAGLDTHCGAGTVQTGESCLRLANGLGPTRLHYYYRRQPSATPALRKQSPLYTAENLSNFNMNKVWHFNRNNLMPKRDIKQLAK